ncbi:hypothetical protein RJ639_009251 [Escallonia herrerae]|uniref:Uncharacterized protein n=1 Tax=Escallonia herrerae TaxID=1293975 RepID=A0AA89ASM8_9ASTE|nr:hypothetical protein RJ639_009251 [Escallonia herrerae]
MMGCCRHEKYVTQYRAIFVINCKTKGDQVSQPGSLKRKRVRRGKGTGPADAGSGRGESLRQVDCAVCSTEVGVIDEDEVYHFVNVLPKHILIFVEMTHQFVDAIGNSSNLAVRLLQEKGQEIH